MNEFINMLKTPQFRAYGSVILGVVVVYTGFQVYKTILDSRFQKQNIKLNGFRILEYKQKYLGLMADKNANENTKYIAGATIPSL